MAKSVDYRTLYNVLYDEHKYHSSETLSHGIKWLKKFYREDPFEGVATDLRSFLDVGCSIGNTMNWAHLHTPLTSVFGLDVSDHAVTRCRQRGLLALRTSATDLPLPNCMYDLVLCTDVLEHLSEQDVLKALRELWRVTRHVLIVAACNHSEVDRRPFDFLKEKHPKLVEDMQDLHLTQKDIGWYYHAIDWGNHNKRLGWGWMMLHKTDSQRSSITFSIPFETF